MARIRTIKPEFWTNEQIAECSPIARLLFVGLWNFSDDRGNHPASFKTLKMEIFPSDDFHVNKISAMVDELIKNGLLVLYEAEGKQYWHVTGWHHQKIDKPNTKYPLLNSGTIRRPFGDHSTTAPRPFDDQSPEDVDVDVDVEVNESKEGKGNRIEKPTTTGDTTRTEEVYSDCFNQHEDRIRVLYPHADFEVERETCIAHYRLSNPPIDCYPVILKWFNRVPKPKQPPSRKSAEDVMTANREAIYDACKQMGVEV